VHVRQVGDQHEGSDSTIRVEDRLAGGLDRAQYERP